MFRKNFILFWIPVFLLVLAIPAYSGILDGKSFVGKNGLIGKSESEDDEIRFANSKFFSVGCGKYGFGETEYTTKVDGDRIFFTADIYSDEWGRITYSGIAVGDSLKATYIWFAKGKYDTPEQVKWWDGKIKK